MQYVRSLAGSVNGAWNSINPATLSGAIDVIVVEQDDASLACSPFHVRFGKWRLLRPYEKKVEFKVNGQKQNFSMKLGEGGEAFFVFETDEHVPPGLQTSPPVSPETSPQLEASLPPAPTSQDPDPLDLNDNHLGTDLGRLTPPPRLSDMHLRRPLSTDMTGYKTDRLTRFSTDSDIEAGKAIVESSKDDSTPLSESLPQRRPPSPLQTRADRSSTSPPPFTKDDANTRAMNLSKKLWASNISNQVTDTGDLMLDMTNYRSGDGDALQAEAIARQLLSEEIDGPYDIGALIGADENGNIWIYSSEEAKDAAAQKAVKALGSYNPAGYASTDALIDQGYHSDDAKSDSHVELSATRARRDSDSAIGINSGPSSPGQESVTPGEPVKTYAKTLRLTSEQLKSMHLRPGANPMSFTVNRATCAANLWYLKHDVPIVISDIDGTITKSDVLGHVMNSIGRDWTHPGVAKLYTEIAANGYNLLYLTSRSVGQADTTRNYLDGVVQDGFRLPKGPVILSPDRTMAALRREVYLRKPELFKMACLRDIMALFSGHGHENPSGLGMNRGRGGSPFYAGFGNRLTDALSYRSVNIPSTRIFTINSYSEVSLDLLSLNNYKTAYATMREIVDYYFPPVGLLVKGGGEDFTDFNYWRQKPLDLVDFTDSESEEDDVIEEALERATTNGTTKGSVLSEDDAMMDSSYLEDPRVSLDGSLLASSAFGDDDDDLANSLLLDDEGAASEEALEEDGDDEYEGDEDPRYSRPTTPELRPQGPGKVAAKDLETTPRRSVEMPSRRSR
ncbi:Lipin/Ned1/Smp2-domain-containing protein [Neohortaea acidophila]|uniref:Lipin/Ned1/Smp2-domain-containing protein n=1 Tax=Neohortaea acidophila TaxID=245834 RepID=A0A6A6PUR3_9PEZI|nr:Lipin/Ned1/Smp2-domain-containing protein [Neohortaea acidophila]KAF2483441.1 Lipin/Ned1/Smp2-domain-containing protein [Neohortaea acidophila]